MLLSIIIFSNVFSIFFISIPQSDSLHLFLISISVFYSQWRKTDFSRFTQLSQWIWQKYVCLSHKANYKCEMSSRQMCEKFLLGRGREMHRHLYIQDIQQNSILLGFREIDLIKLEVWNFGTFQSFPQIYNPLEKVKRYYDTTSWLSMHPLIDQLLKLCALTDWSMGQGSCLALASGLDFIPSTAWFPEHWDKSRLWVPLDVFLAPSPKSKLINS